MTNFKLNGILWNCNGGSKETKMLIHELIRSLKLDICFLTETHAIKKFKPKKWKEINVPDKYAGITIIYNKKTIKINTTRKNPRVIQGHMTMSNLTWKFTVLYAASSSKNCDLSWWRDLELDKQDFIAGDFNIVLDPKRDSVSGLSRSTHGIRDYLLKCLNDHDDVAVANNNLDMTFYQCKRPCSRLDRLYIRKKSIHLNYNLLSNPKGNDHMILTFSHYSKISHHWSFKNYLFNHPKIR